MTPPVRPEPVGVLHETRRLLRVVMCEEPRVADLLHRWAGQTLPLVIDIHRRGDGALQTRWPSGEVTYIVAHRGHVYTTTSRPDFLGEDDITPMPAPTGQPMLLDRLRALIARVPVAHSADLGVDLRTVVQLVEDYFTFSSPFPRAATEAFGAAAQRAAATVYALPPTRAQFRAAIEAAQSELIERYLTYRVAGKDIWHMIAALTYMLVVDEVIGEVIYDRLAPQLVANDGGPVLQLGIITDLTTGFGAVRSITARAVRYVELAARHLKQQGDTLRDRAGNAFQYHRFHDLLFTAMLCYGSSMWLWNRLRGAYADEVGHAGLDIEAARREFRICEEMRVLIETSLGGYLNPDMPDWETPDGLQAWVDSLAGLAPERARSLIGDGYVRLLYPRFIRDQTRARLRLGSRVEHDGGLLDLCVLARALMANLREEPPTPGEPDSLSPLCGLVTTELDWSGKGAEASTLRDLCAETLAQLRTTLAQ